MEVQRHQIIIILNEPSPVPLALKVEAGFSVHLLFSERSAVPNYDPDFSGLVDKVTKMTEGESLGAQYATLREIPRFFSNQHATNDIPEHVAAGALALTSEI
jgi:hypothetical protein